MLNIRDKKQFRKDYRKLKSSGKDLTKLALVIDTLAAEKPLLESFRDHSLIGDYVNCRECHISPDWAAHIPDNPDGTYSDTNRFAQ